MKLKPTNKLKRHLYRIVPSVLFGIFAIWSYTNWMHYKKVSPLMIIPSDAIYVLETNEPLKNWDGFNNSPFWQFLSSHPSLEDVTKDANYLDSLISANKQLLKYFGDNHFIMSAHMKSRYDYDFLFAFDLRNMSNLDVTDLPLSAILGRDYRVSETRYREHDITSIEFIEDGTKAFLTQIENYLLCSFYQPLIHASIDHKTKKVFDSEESFQLSYTSINRDGLAQLYVNFDWLDEFMGVYLRSDPAVEGIHDYVRFSAFDIDLLPNELLADGNCAVPDRSSQYVRLLQQFGNAPMSYDKVISERAAMIQSIHLKDFRSFYKGLLEYRRTNDADVEHFERLMGRVEDYLELSFEEDILSWIGGEIAVVQNVPSQTNFSESDLVVCLKLSDKERAISKLDLIQEQIKKKSIAKFKSLSYRNHDIHYLELKGFFNFFLGSAFNHLNRPYYVIIDDHILFSDNPKSLTAMIEDYENNNTLFHNKAFHKKVSRSKSLCLFSYVNADLVYPWLMHHSLPGHRNSVEENKDFMLYFDQMFVKMVVEDSIFDTQVSVQYGRENRTLKDMNVDSLYSSYTLSRSSDKERANYNELVESKRNSFIRYHEDGSIMIKSAVKGGAFHGAYLEYYSNGQLKKKGKFRSGQKKGHWEYYDENGALIFEEEMDQ